MNHKANEVSELATKMHAAVLAALTDEEKVSSYLLDEAAWLAMQMLCGPHRAASIVSQCQR